MNGIFHRRDGHMGATEVGQAAGIDMSLHLVGERCGADVAADTARFMDYPRAG